ITINGNGPNDIRVNNEAFYARVLREGSLGLGESYMEGWWDCDHLDGFFDVVLCTKLYNHVSEYSFLLFKLFLSKFINPQTKSRSLEVGKKHYDLSNKLFEKMLDSRMNYTCGYWKEAKTLEEAQLAKLELSCQKLLLKPGMRLLDIGCGWGGMAKYAAEKYGVEVVGITISQQQYEYAKNVCVNLPVEIRFQDYRDVTETFDRIVSLGMFEHVGHKNYFTYMKKVRSCLTDDGIFLLHTIGDSITELPNKWITKYIFPHGMLPSIKLIGKAIENVFVLEDLHNFGADYDKTLMAWQQKFTDHWEEIKSDYDERFKRMWNYYLLSCAGGFRARGMQLWQMVLSKEGIRGGYQAPR
ncbi:MAG: cyclopropane fatty acyl phospholipid synthase, partial [Gammaproteobacteria bacterium]|nr:cyclopropane fatty acyl phospholipid synthase [Gammaproteobacteria bacterium]